MRAILLILPILLGTSQVPASAEDAPNLTPLQRTDAFRSAYAASFYEFDACGDGFAGRIYRNALTQKLDRCPFTAEAKQRFRAWAPAQRRKASEAITNLIEKTGGLPVRLDGMTQTCHAQMASAEYRTVRRRLEDFYVGKIGADAVVAQPCDAAEIAP
jgi:hypothetical protein